MTRALLIAALLLGACDEGPTPPSEVSAGPQGAWTHVARGPWADLYRWQDPQTGVICYRVRNAHDDSMSCVRGAR